MKRILIMVTISALVLTGCRNKIEPVMTGSLSLNVEQSEEGFNIVTKANDDKDAFIIDIERPSDNWSVQYVYGDIKGDMISLGSGDYIITAHSPESSHAAWDLPYYSATQEFKITPGEVTPINLNCELANVKVTIVLSEGFKQELSTYNVSVTNGKGKLTWVKDEVTDDFSAEKAGFFTVAPLEVVVNGHRAIDNTSASTTMAISNVVAKNHHIINIDAKVTGQLGGDSDGDGIPDSGIIISIDPKVTPKDEYVSVDGLEEVPVLGGDDEGNDDNDGEGDEPPVTGPAAPELLWEANKNESLETPVEITEDLNADMVILAEGKIAKFTVKVESDQLTAAIQALTSDGSDTMDLIEDKKLIGSLAKMAPALPTGEGLSNKERVDFPLTDLLQLISIYGPNRGDQHAFTLYVEDAIGQSLTIKLTFVSM